MLADSRHVRFDLDRRAGLVHLHTKDQLSSKSFVYQHPEIHIFAIGMMHLKSIHTTLLHSSNRHILMLACDISPGFLVNMFTPKLNRRSTNALDGIHVFSMRNGPSRRVKLLLCSVNTKLCSRKGAAKAH